MTHDQIKTATMAYDKYATLFEQPLNDSCAYYEINTPIRQLCFLAQAGHESMGLFYTEELASGVAYEYRGDLGNINPGDGALYKGRGLIQITGRANYQTISIELGIDCLNNPWLLGAKTTNVSSSEQLQNAARSAGWFWNHTHLNNLADLIDINQPVDTGTNLIYFKQITRLINGGYNGLDDRIIRYNNGVDLFR
jgi:putative chitinase